MVISVQLVASPTAIAFVCSCSVQPRWDGGQESVNWLGPLLAVRLVGYPAGVMVNVPFTKLKL